MIEPIKHLYRQTLSASEAILNNECVALSPSPPLPLSPLSPNCQLSTVNCQLLNPSLTSQTW
ncbi:hypothetical protein [Microcoleus sp. CAWBG556]|uniref:hypothetical protein n=1 Tax=Microcoleus sp. CAWBG556 TaxID=2841650 RepID=UPI0025FF8B23|nr:hypothetical protein [Microcoleus sp. CAWBG556]